jgi:hypothetical protein
MQIFEVGVVLSISRFTLVKKESRQQTGDEKLPDVSDYVSKPEEPLL